MAGSLVQFPGPGCVVEFMQGNKAVQAWVLESQGASLRLLTEGRREIRLALPRLLPWYGPQYAPGPERQEIAALLERHRVRREELAAGIDMEAIWELAQGEVERAPAAWLAELIWAEPDADQVAAMGHAALECKSRFKFSPPAFEIYSAEKAAARKIEEEAREKREAFASRGGEFFRSLWEIHCGRRGPLRPEELPPPELAGALETILRGRLADPELHDADGSWKLLVKSLPEEPHLPLRLAVAWGLVPEHHNVWLDQAGYDASPRWAELFGGEIEALRRNTAAAVEECAALEEKGNPAFSDAFCSIDAASTRDVDDAVSLIRDADGSFKISLIFACPALCWPFGGALDKAVLRRASSIYLPEGDLHMLPENVGLGLFSLSTREKRPVLRLDAHLDSAGAVLSLEPRLALVRLASRLTFEGVQAVLEPESEGHQATEEQTAEAGSHREFLHNAYALARLLQEQRLAGGAVITERTDPVIGLEEGEDGETLVYLEPGPVCPAANLLVSELMILANHGLASWAHARGIPLFYRTQDVALPKEFAGVWTEPHEITRAVRNLPAAGLETAPRPHAGLGLKLYAPMTSPLRRYADLINEAQIVHFLQTGSPRFSKQELAAALPLLTTSLDQATRVQRSRPRYWKLLFFRQMGDRLWWDAVLTEENDHMVTLSLSLAQINVRARRRFFGEKLFPGQKFKVRLGKINPLLGEIQVIDSQEE